MGFLPVINWGAHPFTIENSRRFFRWGEHFKSSRGSRIDSTGDTSRNASAFTRFLCGIWQKEVLLRILRFSPGKPVHGLHFCSRVCYNIERLKFKLHFSVISRYLIYGPLSLIKGDNFGYNKLLFLKQLKNLN